MTSRQVYPGGFLCQFLLALAGNAHLRQDTVHEAIDLVVQFGAWQHPVASLAAVGDNAGVEGHVTKALAFRPVVGLLTGENPYA